MIQPVKNKNIVIGVCGGIAAYKAVELLRLLKKLDANVQTIMTQNALKFVCPLTFEALSGNMVLSSVFDRHKDASISHIKLATEAYAVIIAPATANMIGKIASGIADDVLSTFILAVKSLVIICPSMNTRMYESKAVQRNLAILKQDGFIIVEPGTGSLACGTSGAGRLPEPNEIINHLLFHVTPKDFKEKKFLITAGPTWEHLDPVRFITNPSSGKMGYAIARAAANRGGNVTLISGPTNLDDIVGVNTIKIKTASEMASAVFKHFEQSDIIIKAAAVSDYRPKEQANQKIKKDKDEMILALEKNIDILKEIGKRKTKQFLVGFAAETNNLADYAKNKLIEKNLDIIVGNLVGPSVGFGTDTNSVVLFYKDGKKEAVFETGKDEIADILLDRVKNYLDC